MNLVEAAAELTGHVPRLSFLLAKKLVNRAWRDILDERLWTFTVEEGAFLAPQSVTSGLVTVTQGSASVVGDADAKIAWDAIALATVPLTKRQFRLSTSGPIYNINAYDSGTITLTLDRIYLEPTLALVKYRIYRVYYEPPDDFRSFISMVNHIDGYPLRLHWTRKEIDIRDPVRGADGLAYYASSYKVRADGRPIYELWPHTTSERTYSFVYQRLGIDLTDIGTVTDSVPATLNSAVLVQRSLFHTYQWAEANRGRYPDLQGADWRYLRSDARANYERVLQEAKVKDEEIFLQSYVIPYIAQYGSPIDAKFAQAHDVQWIWLFSIIPLWEILRGLIMYG